MASPTPGKDQETIKPGQNAKITLYWLDRSRSQRILWLLEELHQPYDLETFKRQKSGLAPPELKQIHPLGKSPIVSIASGSNPDAEPLVLAESGVIFEYLIDHFGPWLAPERYAGGKGGKVGEVGGESESWMRYRYYMHYAEGTLMPFLVIMLILNAIKTSTPFLIRPLALLITAAIESKFLHPNLRAQWDFLESQLATSPDGGDYLCGANLTGADIMMSFPLGAARSRALFTEKEHPKLCGYVDRLEAMPAWKKAVGKIEEIDEVFERI